MYECKYKNNYKYTNDTYYINTLHAQSTLTGVSSSRYVVYAASAGVVQIGETDLKRIAAKILRVCNSRVFRRINVRAGFDRSASGIGSYARRSGRHQVEQNWT